MSSFQDSLGEDSLPEDLDFDEEFGNLHGDLTMFADMFGASSGVGGPPPLVVAANGAVPPTSSSTNLSRLLGELMLDPVPAPPPLPPPTSSRPSSKSGVRDDRREKNREAARNSRQKKKQYVNVLEDQIKQLNLQVLQLREAHVRATHQKARDQVTALLGRGAFREALEIYGPAGSSRRRIAAYRFENLVRNAVPAHLRVLSWTINQRANDLPDWDRYINHLRLTEENKQRFVQTIQTKVATGEEAVQERLRLDSTFGQLIALQRRYIECAANLSRHHARIANVFTPNQAAAYFAWVERRRVELERLVGAT